MLLFLFLLILLFIFLLFFIFFFILIFLFFFLFLLPAFAYNCMQLQGLLNNYYGI